MSEINDGGASYAAWRFNVWYEARELSYDQIDRLVSDGVVTPGMSAGEVLAARRGDRASKLRAREK